MKVGFIGLLIVSSIFAAGALYSGYNKFAQTPAPTAPASAQETERSTAKEKRRVEKIIEDKESRKIAQDMFNKSRQDDAEDAKTNRR